MGNLSAIPAPSGLTSNFINPPSKVVWDTVTQVVCLTVASLLVAMRMYTKIRVLRHSGLDDCKVHDFQSTRLSRLISSEIHHFLHG